MVHIIILGPPGIGKGTQAQIYSETHNIAHISTGDILRTEATQNTPLGKEIKKIINDGNYAPDKIITALLKKRLQEEDCKNGAVFDGYPRTEEQAQALEAIIKINYAIYLHAPEEKLETMILERLGNRTQCTICKQVYNTKYAPQKTGMCNKCGGHLAKRADDTPETIKKRIDTYNKLTKPIIEFYKKKGILYQIDGTKTPEEIAKEIEGIAMEE